MISSPFPPSGQSISFGERLASSASFDGLFRDGMALVEETAAYLDSAGRDEARALPRIAALAYASESMRLTTRLMQIASWLLLQRAVNEGEMTEADAAGDKDRSRTAWHAATSPGAGCRAMRGEGQDEHAGLPATLVELIAKSLRLQERVQRLDAAIGDQAMQPAATPAVNPLEAQFAMIRNAFPG